MPKENVLKNETLDTIQENDSNLSLTTPTKPNHITNKEYVDKQIQEEKDYLNEKKQDKLILGGNHDYSTTYLKWENNEKTQLTIDNTKLNKDLDKKADKTQLETKQDKLTAGENIDIDESLNLISYKPFPHEAKMFLAQQIIPDIPGWIKYSQEHKIFTFEDQVGGGFGPVGVTNFFSNVENVAKLQIHENRGQIYGISINDYKNQRMIFGFQGFQIYIYSPTLYKLIIEKGLSQHTASKEFNNNIKLQQLEIRDSNHYFEEMEKWLLNMKDKK